MERADLRSLFRLADAYAAGAGPRFDAAAAMFFPAGSLRTRAAFERGAALAGIQPIVFPPEALEKPEAAADVAAYLANVVDLLIVRHPLLELLEALAAAEAVPVINAMTDANHPCEVLGDLYGLSRGHGEATPRPLEQVLGLRYLFVGADTNIARAWREAAGAFGLNLTQVSPSALAMDGVRHTEDLEGALETADVVLTDGPGKHADALAPYAIDAARLSLASTGAAFNPCPPFLRGRELTADALRHPAFVGHGFKRALLPLQQAIMATALGDATMEG